MPLTAKERAQRYRDRIKADPDRHKSYLEDERERWLKRTTTGKVKSIDDLSERAKRQKRKTWKKASHRYQVKKRETRRIEEYIQLNSPPTSPVDLEPPVQAFAFGVGPAPRPPNNRGRRRIHHLNRSRTVRKLHKVEQELKQQERLVEKYKKRLNRLKSKEIKKMLPEKDSPRTKTNRLIREFGNGNVTSKVRKTLIFHHTLVEELKQKRNKGRQAKLNGSISGKVLAKYRLLDEARKQLKISRRQLQEKAGPVKKRGNPGIPRTYKERILTFYERDDVSRIKPGKRDTITKQKDKKQIRLLSDTLLNLYNKFMSENTFIRVSYSSFCNLRPFWVKPPSLKDRDTCLCKRHENAQLLIERLVSLKLTSSAFSSVDTFVDSLCCKYSLECMLGKCEQCQDKSIKVTDENVLGSQTVWYQWANSKKSIVTAKKSSGGEEVKEIKIVVKQKIDGTVQEMIKCLEEQIPNLCEHVYNLRHQFHQSKMLKTYCSSKSDHAIIHIDFSENWESKYGNEIQSVHFGGSHVQVTLHTGILYIAEECIPFCTVSDATRHGPPAIWAYLDPVLSYINQHYPGVRYLHFQSDGPSTQYKNKTNFFFLSGIPFDKGFWGVTWDYWESGHGKGAPDGVGAVIKRTADSLVSHGTDIPNAESLFEELTSKCIKVKLFYVPSTDIPPYDLLVPKQLQVVKGTMKIHQIYSTTKFELQIRNLSCYCTETSLCEICQCYDPREARVVSPNYEIVDPEPTEMEGTSIIEHRHNDKRDANPTTDILQPPKPDALPEELINEWCVVDYDHKPFLGQILQADEDGVEVSTMQPIGQNKFVWPALKDEIWYAYPKVITLVDKPERISSRRELYQVPKFMWAKIEELF